MARYQSKKALAQGKAKALTEIKEKPKAQKEHDFVLLYFKTGKMGEAARQAGFTGTSGTVAVMATSILKKPKAQAMLQALRQRAQERTEITSDKLLKELGKVAFANMRNYVRLDKNGDPHPDLSDLDEEGWAAIEELTTETYIEGSGDYAREVKRVKIKLSPKLAAIEKAMKHLGMFDKRRSGGMDDPEGDEAPAQIISYTLNIGGNAAIQFKGDGQANAPKLIEHQGEDEE